MSCAGTAATAEAVSCPATAMTGTFPIPVSLANPSLNVPIIVPGITGGRTSEEEIPAAFSREVSNCRVTGLSSWGVEAFVYSQTYSPTCEQVGE